MESSFHLQLCELFAAVSLETFLIAQKRMCEKRGVQIGMRPTRLKSLPHKMLKYCTIFALGSAKKNTKMRNGGGLGATDHLLITAVSSHSATLLRHGWCMKFYTCRQKISGSVGSNLDTLYILNTWQVKFRLEKFHAGLRALLLPLSLQAKTEESVKVSGSRNSGWRIQISIATYFT